MRHKDNNTNIKTTKKQITLIRTITQSINTTSTRITLDQQNGIY